MNIQGTAGIGENSTLRQEGTLHKLAGASRHMHELWRTLTLADGFISCTWQNKVSMSRKSQLDTTSRLRLLLMLWSRYQDSTLPLSQDLVAVTDPLRGICSSNRMHTRSNYSG